MTKNSRTLGLLVVTVLTLLVIMTTGCGGDEETTTDETPATDSVDKTSTIENEKTTTTSEAGGVSGDLESQLTNLENLEATVEVVSNGEPVVKWSQKQGNWRWEDPNDASSYVIYNQDQDKLWIVSGDVATESPGAEAEGQAWWGMSPAAMIGTFAAFPGSISGDTLEINIPGGGSVKVEFKGPQGLPSKMTTVDPDTNETETVEFLFTNVGSVPSDLFELPSNVTVQSLPDLEDLPNADNLDTVVPDMPST